jgi:HD-like signal output (HDOD) protein
MAAKSLQFWVDKLAKVDMPVLANIAKELNELTGSDESDVNQLAEVILKDANLTSQVLRIANSVQYNPSSYPINTVSRAIVLIGFTGVRAICISVMVIDSLLGKEPRERLLEGMAQGFHAAVQAKNLVRRTNDLVKEEVFIAALLYHLGEMAFWACGGNAADELDDLYKSNMDNREAMTQVTGTSFKAITKALAGIWKLGDTLEQALSRPADPSAKVLAVCLGEEISRKAKFGWRSKEVNETLKKVAKFTGVDIEQAREMAMNMADKAAEVAVTYGVSKVCRLIPTSKNFTLSEQAQEEASSTPLLKSDPQLQLNILRDLSNALSEQLDVNAIFQMVLEGLHRGVGLERVAVAFIQKEQVKLRYVLGEGTDEWREKFHFSVSKMEDNLFSYAIKENQPLWINKNRDASLKHLYSAEMRALIGIYPAFIANIRLGSRDVAIFYADRWNLGGSLNDEQFASFRHFALQTQMSLQSLTKK